MVKSAEKKQSDKIVIKKYANRRLYDTDSSVYVTLDDLCKMVKDGVEFTVVDSKTDEDLTRIILTQIIFEQESKGYNLLPEGFLRQIISFYDDSLGSFLPSYLEGMMSNFTGNQEKMREQVKAFEQYSPVKQFEAMGSQNVEMFEKAMKMFSQFNPMMPEPYDAPHEGKEKKDK